MVLQGLRVHGGNAGVNMMVFRTGGSWESTTLQRNGSELPADELFVELSAGRDEYGEPENGGITLGGEMAAYVRAQTDPHQQTPIFPGRLEMYFPEHSVVIENTHPSFAFEFTRVWYNEREITRSVMDIAVQINAPENIASAGLVMYRPHLLGSDEVLSVSLL